MRRYSYTAALAVALMAALAVAALANGVTPRMAPRPLPQVVPAPVTPAQPGMGPTTAPVITPAPTTTPQQKCYTFDQLVTLTVAEAWDLSGRNVTVFRDIVRMMANVSAQKRGIAIPNTTTAGMEIGRTIRQRAQADPNQLLYSVVDSSVRDYGAAHTPVR